MPKSAAESALEASSGRKRDSGPMPPFALPITEVLVVAECWQTEPDAEAIIQRAVAVAAEIVNAGLGEAELAVMLTDDAGIRTLNSNWRGIDKPRSEEHTSELQSHLNLVCRLLLEKKKKKHTHSI